MSLLIKGGRVIDPVNNIDGIMDVLIEKGKISKVGKNIKTARNVVDGKGKVVCPGLIDMHVHLRDPGYEYKEDILSGAEAAAAGGFTSIVCMANTKPVNDNQSVTKYICEKAENVPVNVYPVPCISKGMKSEILTEFAELVEAGAVAFSDDGLPVTDGALMRAALEYSKTFDVPIMNHCEDPAIADEGVMHEGAEASLLALPGLCPVAEESMMARDILLAEFTGGRYHAQHISTARGLDIIKKAKKRGINVTAEVTPHHLVLNDEAVRTMDFDTNTKMKPPLRSEEDRKALVKGLKDGSIDVIATDHAPHHKDEKDLEYLYAPFGIVGLETAISLVLDRFVNKKVIDLKRMVELMSVNPARILNLKNKGSLSEGADGDVTILDLNAKVTVNKDNFKSKSKNSPFDGWKLKGAPAMTIVKGKIVWQAD